MATKTTATNGHGTQTVHDLLIGGLRATPAESWERMKRFAGPTKAEQAAMRKTVDVLFQRGYELVVNTYEYLSEVPETAEILGWEGDVDEEHLAERRRFFTIWLARVISMDMGTDLANYLFYAGKVHAAHGPREIHTAPPWVTGSMGLVLGAFSEFIQEAHDDATVVGPALTGWNKILMMHLNQMQEGYEAALALDDGPLRVPVRAFGRVRKLWGRTAEAVHVWPSMTVEDGLRRVLDYAPDLQADMCEVAWASHEDPRDDWLRVEAQGRIKDNGWRVLRNGKDIRYHGGVGQMLEDGDVLELFPPGR